MRVLVAPDAFGGALTAPAASRAIAEGWARRAPGDRVTLAPMSGGGAGFVGAVHEAVGGTVDVVTVAGPDGSPVPATLLRAGEVAYVESAQVCGPTMGADANATSASSLGVGQAVATALDAGARRVVVGVGASVVGDGGAGVLAALGATADVPLDAGPDALDGVALVDLGPARDRVGTAELVVATDVTHVLLGLFGTTNVDGASRGLDDAARLAVDRRLDAFVDAACGATPAQRRVADEPGAGAGGGIGFALLLLGATRTSAVGLVADAAGLPALARDHDVVLTGEEAYDFSSREGSVAYGVAAVAADALRPCVVLAERVLVGAREMRAMGVEAAYAVADTVGEDAVRRDPAAALADLAQRVARTWSF